MDADESEPQARPHDGRLPEPLVSLLAELEGADDDKMDEAIWLLQSHVSASSGANSYVVEQLSDLFARRGRIPELRDLVRGPFPSIAVRRLAQWHVAQGDPEAALEALRQYGERGASQEAALMVAALLAEIGRLDEAITELRPLALAEGAYPYDAAPALLTLLTDNGRHEQALAFINEVAAGGEIPLDYLDWHADLLRHSSPTD